MPALERYPVRVTDESPLQKCDVELGSNQMLFDETHARTNFRSLVCFCVR